MPLPPRLITITCSIQLQSTNLRFWTSEWELDIKESFLSLIKILVLDFTNVLSSTCTFINLVVLPTLSSPSIHDTSYIFPSFFKFLWQNDCHSSSFAPCIGCLSGTWCIMIWPFIKYLTKSPSRWVSTIRYACSFSSPFFLLCVLCCPCLLSDLEHFGRTICGQWY